MNHFLTQLPVIITQFSLALIKALTDQLKWLGSIYYHIETALLGTVADISLAILSLRYVFLLLLIGGALGYFGLWWFLAVYVLIILIAVVQFFQSARLPPDPDVEKAHQELRDKSVKFLRMPLRALAMLVSLYFSWQFMDWKAITPSSFETLAGKEQVKDFIHQAPANKNNSSHPVIGGSMSAKIIIENKHPEQVCNQLVQEFSFSPTLETNQNPPIIEVVQPGSYRLMTTGIRTQYYYRNGGSQGVSDKFPQDADGVLKDRDGNQTYINDTDPQSILFPSKPYAAFVVSIDDKKFFAGSDISFTVSSQEATLKAMLNVNQFLNPGVGIFNIKLYKCA